MLKFTVYQERRFTLRSASGMLLAGLLMVMSPVVFGQDAENEPEGEVVGEPLKIDHIPAFETNRAAVKRAEALFESSIEAYRNTLALRDTATIRSISTYAGNSNEQSFDVPLLLTGDAMWIKLNEGKFTVVDNTIYGEFERESARLFITDYEGPITVDLFVDILYLFPVVHIPMRYSEDPLENLFLANIEPKIVGHRRIYLAEPDAEFDEIRISSTGDGAPIELRFDAETGLISRFRTELRDPNMNEMDGTEIIVEFHAELLAEAPIEEFIIELEGRREVDSLGALYQPPNIQDLIQQPTPEFELKTIDGETIRSETMAGNVMVLAFWQIEHEGLFPVLPALNQLTEWRDEEGKSVEIFAVNAGDPIDLLRTVWNEQEYILDLLVDEDFDAAGEIFKIGIIPTIIVITADGVIHAVHSSFEFDADVFAILKESVIDALNKGI